MTNRSLEYIYTSLCQKGFEVGYWKGSPLKDLETSHLLNIKKMLNRLLGESEHINDMEASKEYHWKITEVDEILEKRKDEVISRHEFRITEADLIEYAKSKGVKIPKSGAGIYIGTSRVSELFLRYDTTTKVKNGR